MRLQFLALCAIVTFAAGLASAETASESALALGHRGLAAFEAGDFQAAERCFAEAELTAHSPVFLLYLARSTKSLGDVARARVLLRRVAEEPLTPSSPPAFRRAVDDARREGAELDAEFVFLAIRLDGGFAFPVRVAGTAHTSMLLGPLAELAVDRGTKDIELLDANGSVLHVSVSEATKVDSPWVISRYDRAPSLEAPPPPERPVRERAPAPRRPPHRSAAFVALGLGGLGLVAGGIAGTAAWVLANDLRATCDEEGYCPAEGANRAEEAGRVANLATAAFVSAGAGVLVGVTLLVIGDAQRTARLEVAANGLRASGSF